MQRLTFLRFFFVTSLSSLITLSPLIQEVKGILQVKLRPLLALKSTCRLWSSVKIFAISCLCTSSCLCISSLQFVCLSPPRQVLKLDIGITTFEVCRDGISKHLFNWKSIRDFNKDVLKQTLQVDFPSRAWEKREKFWHLDTLQFEPHT